MPGAGPSSQAGRTAVVAVGTAFLCSAVAWFSYLNRSFELDDALIYHRYVRNALEGAGLVYNSGERLNALTSPLFTYISLVGARITGNVQAASVVIAGVTLALALCVWWRVVASNANLRAGFVGALLAVSFPYLYTVYGMETPLFLLLIATCFHFFETRNDIGLGAASALLLLSRAEGIFLVLPLAVEHIRLRRPLPALTAFVTPVLILASHFLFTYAYYGVLLPDTAAVKIHQGQSGLWGPWPPFARVGYQVDWFFGGKEYLVVALLALAVLGAIESRRTLLSRVALVFLVLYTGFFVFLSLPNYHWYYAPHYLFGFLWAGVGTDRLWRLTRAVRSSAVRRATGTALVALILLLIAEGLTSASSGFRRSRTASAYRQIGEWLEENTPPEATVAAMEIGALGWYSRRYMIDIVGLVTPENDRLLAAGQFDAWLAVHEPDYVVTHVPEWRMERVAAGAVREGQYRRVEADDIGGLQLLEKNPFAAAAGIDVVLTSLRGSADLDRRARAIDVILAGGMGPLVQLAGDEVVAVNLSPDRWTRSTRPAAIVVRNDGVGSRVIELQLHCAAPPEALPVTAFIEGADGIRALEFLEAGTRSAELPAIHPGHSRLFTVWTDKAWQPGAKDRRWLGVNILVRDPG